MREVDDNELLRAMRRADVAAIEEFIRRFEPVVMHQARRFRIARAEQSEWVSETLHHLALTLARPSEKLTGSLTGYVMSACRRNVLNTLRDRRRRSAIEHSGLCDLPGVGESAVITLCSEASLRASRGDGGDEEAVSPALARLVGSFDRTFTSDERRLLSWVGQRVPYSTIAEWLGEKRTTVVKRVTRLRHRIRRAAVDFAASSSASDRLELMRFFLRSGVFSTDELAGLDRDAGDTVSINRRRVGEPARRITGDIR